MRLSEAGKSGIRLPDDDALLGRQVHAFTFVDVESLVELVHVPDREDGPDMAGRVRIRLHLRLQCLVADLLARDRRIGDEEPLLRGQVAEILVASSVSTCSRVKSSSSLDTPYRPRSPRISILSNHRWRTGRNFRRGRPSAGTPGWARTARAGTPTRESKTLGTGVSIGWVRSLQR